MPKKSKKWILDHYVCDGQLSIDDLPFTDKNVDNFVISVDNNSNTCINCILQNCENCDVVIWISKSENWYG